MHASAQQPTLLEYTGTLTVAAQMRTSTVASDSVNGPHIVPVLCLDIVLDNPIHTHLHVEQPFPAGKFEQAEAAAHRLKKGMRVTVQTPLEGLQLTARNTAHIHTHTQEEKTA